MANKLEHLELDSRALKAKLICQDCHRNPRPEVQLYICMYCNVYKCGICRDKSKFPMLFNYSFSSLDFCIILKCLDNYCLNGHVTFLEPTLTMITSAFTTYLCIMSKNGCKEEVDVKKLKDHEKYCIFQNVQCPIITCTESIIFKDAQKHLDETHKCLKADDEWEFEGTTEDMVQNVCCLSSYGKQFFVQFQFYEKKCEGTWNYEQTHRCGYQVRQYNGYDYACPNLLTYRNNGTCRNSVKENLLFLRIVMLGHQDEAHSFQVTMTYFHENGKRFSTEVDVLPITSGKEEIDSFNAIPTKKLGNYYDVKAGEFKTQLIQFTLKITNEKLDEIAKDKNAKVKSGLEGVGKKYHGPKYLDPKYVGKYHRQ